MASRARAITTLPAPATAIVVGILHRIDDTGAPYVTLPGVDAPVAARTAVQFAPSADLASKLIGCEVLVHRSGDQSMPIIVGFVTDSILARHEGGASSLFDSDAKRLNLVAQEELTLQCGKSTIVLRRDGTLIVKGVNVTSRASSKQKIQGPTVNIN